MKLTKTQRRIRRLRYWLADNSLYVALVLYVASAYLLQVAK